MSQSNFNQQQSYNQGYIPPPPPPMGSGNYVPPPPHQASPQTYPYHPYPNQYHTPYTQPPPSHNHPYSRKRPFSNISQTPSNGPHQRREEPFTHSWHSDTNRQQQRRGGGGGGNHNFRHNTPQNHKISKQSLYNTSMANDPWISTKMITTEDAAVFDLTFATRRETHSKCPTPEWTMTQDPSTVDHHINHSSIDHQSNNNNAHIHQNKEENDHDDDDDNDDDDEDDDWSDEDDGEDDNDNDNNNKSNKSGGNEPKTTDESLYDLFN